MRFIFSSVISILPFVLMLASCDRNESAETSQPDTTVVEGEPTTPTSKREWKRVYIDWAGSEASCTTGQLSITRSGMIESVECGEIKSAEISKDELAEVHAQIVPILNDWVRPLNCIEEAVQDLVLDMKIIDSLNRTRRVYRFDDESVCFRGGDRERFSALEERLGLLQAKYLETPAP